jgi:hypothetical protein
MELFEIPQSQRDLIAVNNAAASAKYALVNAIQQLNHSYQTVWSLPDDRLLAVLQYMADNGKLQPTLELHNISATTLNTLAEVVGIPDRAFDSVPRPFTVGPDGKVSFVPPA